jgi:hypothetical protein
LEQELSAKAIIAFLDQLVQDRPHCTETVTIVNSIKQMIIEFQSTSDERDRLLNEIKVLKSENIDLRSKLSEVKKSLQERIVTTRKVSSLSAAAHDGDEISKLTETEMQAMQVLQGSILSILKDFTDEEINNEVTLQTLRMKM